jgi:hypothetical protein
MHEFTTQSVSKTELHRDNRDMTGWILLHHETFNTGAGWSGTNVVLQDGIDPGDPYNRVVVLSEDGDSSFFNNFQWPTNSFVMTFITFSENSKGRKR